MPQNPYAKFEDFHDADVPSATLAIYNGIASMAKDGESTINRASAAPMCVRRRWYSKSGEKAEPITPRKRVNFWLGDLTEIIVLALIKQHLVGPGCLYSEIYFGKPVLSFDLKGLEVTIYTQDDDSSRIGPYEFTCHPDGWGKRNSDGKWELIECKSAADFGFERFKSQGPDDYLKQASVNLRSNSAIKLGATDVRYFYLKKNTGHLWDRLHHFDQYLFEEVLREAKLANGQTVPERPYKPENETFRSKPTGRRKLPWQCGYCAFTQKCWPEAKLEFKSNKPMWVVPKETNGVTQA